MTDQERVVIAYRNLFSGRGGEDDIGIVLSDLSHLCRFFDTTSLDPVTRQRLPPDEASEQVGMRRVFLRILRFAGYEDRIHEILRGRHGRPADTNDGND